MKRLLEGKVHFFLIAIVAIVFISCALPVTPVVTPPAVVTPTVKNLPSKFSINIPNTLGKPSATTRAIASDPTSAYDDIKDSMSMIMSEMGSLGLYFALYDEILSTLTPSATPVTGKSVTLTQDMVTLINSITEEDQDVAIPFTAGTKIDLDPFIYNTTVAFVPVTDTSIRYPTDPVAQEYNFYIETVDQADVEETYSMKIFWNTAKDKVKIIYESKFTEATAISYYQEAFLFDLSKNIQQSIFIEKLYADQAALTSNTTLENNYYSFTLKKDVISTKNGAFFYFDATESGGTELVTFNTEGYADDAGGMIESDIDTKTIGAGTDLKTLGSVYSRALGDPITDKQEGFDTNGTTDTASVSAEYGDKLTQAKNEENTTKSSSGSGADVSATTPSPIILKYDTTGANKVLMILNTSADENGAPEEIGTGLPVVTTPVVASVRSLGSVSPTRTMSKDRILPDMPFEPVSRSLASRAISADLAVGSIVSLKIAVGNATVDKDCVLKFNGTKGLIFSIADLPGDNGALDDAGWNAVGAAFENLYTTITNIYGVPSDVDSNGKIIIVYYGMLKEDGTGAKDAGTLGFAYSAVDLYPTKTNSNGAEIFYMNTNWGAPTDAEMIRTIAHEFVHVIISGQRRIVNQLPSMSTFMNEGLAELAEYFASGNLGTRLAALKNDANGLVRAGLPLCVWGKGTDENYAQSLSFMAYLYGQSKSKAFAKELVTNQFGDPRAIGAVMAGYNSSFKTFEDVLYNWRLANIFLDATGNFGYNGIATLVNAQLTGIKYLATTTDNIKLSPGGTLYIPVDTSVNVTGYKPAGQGTNIKYVQIY